MKKLLFIILVIMITPHAMHSANQRSTAQDTKSGIFYAVGKSLWGYVPAIKPEARAHQRRVNEYIEVNKKSETWKTGRNPVRK